MRKIAFKQVVDEVASICLKAAYDLPDDVLKCIQECFDKEDSERGKEFLRQYLANADIAKKERAPLCQDTGTAVYFVEIGEEVIIDGGTIYEAVAAGTAKGYKEGYLRKSIVSDPIFGRKNTGDNTPPVVHLNLIKGSKLKIILAPKGGGSENMSQVKMLKPSDGRHGVVQTVVNAVISAGGNPCPPTIVGVGIGGTFEKAAFLAKKALLREVGSVNEDENYALMEKEILEKINSSNVGPQGLGGKTTALAVHIEYFPCHIASLPVAINLNCHAARHAEFEI